MPTEKRDSEHSKAFLRDPDYKAEVNRQSQPWHPWASAGETMKRNHKKQYTMQTPMEYSMAKLRGPSETWQGYRAYIWVDYRQAKIR